MCYKDGDTYQDVEKYNECCILFEKMIIERTKIENKTSENIDQIQLQLQTVIINDKIYCKVNEMLFYCCCFQTVGLNDIKLIHSPCTIICLSSTNPARKYAENNNITILSSIIIHMFGMNSFLPKIHLCNKREQNEYISRYGDIQFTPKIMHKDPYIQYIGAKKGDLLRIYRKQSVSTYIYYRYVI